MRAAGALIMTLLLCGCSYSYDVEVSSVGGQLIFSANPQWGADCVREIEVEADDDTVRAKANRDDDASSVQSGTFWQASVAHEDACENHFPLAYGTTLKGRPWTYETGGLLPNADGQRAPLVAPKELRIEAIYSVHTTTGSTGYGCGRFIIHRDRSVENLRCT